MRGRRADGAKFNYFCCFLVWLDAERGETNGGRKQDLLSAESLTLLSACTELRQRLSIYVWRGGRLGEPAHEESTAEFISLASLATSP